jgi:hypothetical protein
MPAGRACPRIAGAGGQCCPWRVVGAGAGTEILSRVRVCDTCIRGYFTRCHLYTGHRSFAEGLYLCRESNIGRSAKNPLPRVCARQRILCRESVLGKDRLSANPIFAESSTLGKDWLSAKPIGLGLWVRFPAANPSTNEISELAFAYAAPAPQQRTRHRSEGWPGSSEAPTQVLLGLGAVLCRRDEFFVCYFVSGRTRMVSGRTRMRSHGSTCSKELEKGHNPYQIWRKQIHGS